MIPAATYKQRVARQHAFHHVCGSMLSLLCVSANPPGGPHHDEQGGIQLANLFLLTDCCCCCSRQVGPTMMSKEARHLFLAGGGEEALAAWKVRRLGGLQAKGSVVLLNCFYLSPAL